MAKDPAFLFYPGDFSTGTQFFSDEQVGKYMRLLMAQHQHGHLTENQVIFICKSYDKDIMSKFTKDSKGLWYNERLEIEIEKRKNYVLSRSKNKEGKTKEKIISKSYDPHMENENENRNDIDLKLKESLDDLYLDQQKPKWAHIDFDFEYRTFCDKVRGSPDKYIAHDVSGMRLAFQSQLRFAKTKINGSHKTTKLTPEELKSI